MKKLINRPEDVVPEMIDGMVALHPGLARLSEHQVIIRADATKIRNEQVALISGGGSGHEPAHAGYVGSGMLSAAVAGEVFSSPSPQSVFAAIRAVAGSPGALLIVKNYTGDRLNFGMAAEMARAEGITVDMVIVADDIALAGTEQYAGARGLAGTVFVHKIAGAAAAQGRSLQQVADLARECAVDVATMGIALSAGRLPSSGRLTFEIGEGEIEFGLGIHGEPGVQRMHLRSANELASDLVERLVIAQHLAAGDQISLMINNLGATTEMEMAIFGRAAMRELHQRSIAVQRVYSGPFMTSLESAGVSLTTLRVNEDRLALLDAPTAAPGWRTGLAIAPRNVELRTVSSSSPSVTPEPELGLPMLVKCVAAACDAIERSEAELTELDQSVGDGDLGTNLARGARALRHKLDLLGKQSAGNALATASLTVQEAVGGSSGALYGVLLMRAGNALSHADRTSVQSWADAFSEACVAVSEIGDAHQGDRTMLDALLPFAATFKRELDSGSSVSDSLQSAAKAAQLGADATATMPPRRGRSSYLGTRVLGHRDPGAVAAAHWLEAVVSAICYDLGRS